MSRVSFRITSRVVTSLLSLTILALSIGGTASLPVVQQTGPVAVATATPTSGAPPLAVAFSSAGSFDPEGVGLSFDWTFGDGSTSTTANPTHTYQAEGVYVARLTVSDSAGTSSTEVMITVGNPSRGLVAAYSFNEGTGATVADASGTGNTGTIIGATWTSAGKYGNALVFNGAGALVTVKDSTSLQLSTGMTLAAWVYPTASGGWRDVICQGEDTYYLAGFSPRRGVPAMGGAFSPKPLHGTTALPLNAWSHLAATYDGETMRLYVNGVQVAGRAQTGPIPTPAGALTIGGDALYGQYWEGLIDEVRIYSRPLSAGEIETDMATPVAVTADSLVSANEEPVAVASALPRSGAPPLVVKFSSAGSLHPEGKALSYSWTFGDGSTSKKANPIHTYQAEGVYVARLIVADGAGTSSTEVIVTVGDPSGVTILASGQGGTTSPTGDVLALTGSATTPAPDTTEPAALGALEATAVSGSQINITLTVGEPPSGLVAAYSFNEGTGTSAADASGNGNTGTIVGAAWTPAGKYGNALVFNGTNALITINDSASLDLTTAMTLEAWVNPSAVSSAWRDVIYKGNDNYYLEGTSATSGAPAAGGTFAATEALGTAALAVNTWTHLAATYDGATLRLYLNGVQVSSLVQTGNISTSTNPLQIGGDSIYGQYFQGIIDEVKIYNRALTPGEIQNDMNTPISPTPDTEPPTAPATLTAAAVSGTQINLSWTASTDNVGVTGYRVERCQGAGCTTFAQVGTATGTTYNDTGLTVGASYSYQVRATDAAGNLSLYSNVAGATTPVPDTEPPTPPGTLTAAAVSGTQINLSWTASTDNVGVTGYLLERCQGAGCASFAQIGTATGTTFNDTGLTVGTSYSYRVRATDAAGNLSQYSSVATAITQQASDTTPPAAPSKLMAATISSSQIDLSWTASTDNVGVTGYRVERCQGAGCTTFAQIGTATAATHNDTGLTANTSYSYQVRATDAAGNLSPYSNVASATTQAPAAIAFRQVNSAIPQTPQATVSVAYTSAQTAGDLNVVVVGWNDSSAQVSTVKDSQGNVYTRAVGPTIVSGALSQSIYYAKNIVAAAANSNIVTVQFSAPAIYPDIRILEYSGLDTANPVDVTAAATGTSASSGTGSMTTTNANDLLFAANTVLTYTTGPGAGFTSRIITTPDGDIAEDRIVTATGSYSATAPLSSSGPWVMQLVAFKAAGGGP